MEESNRPKVFNLKFISYLKTLVKKGEWKKFREEADKRWDKAKKAGIVVLLLLVIPFPILAKTKYVVTLKETSRVKSDNPSNLERVKRSAAGLSHSTSSGGLGKKPLPSSASKDISGNSNQTAGTSVTTYPKYLTVAGEKAREKVLTYLSSYYARDELIAADNILKKESGYRYDAVNEIGACGLVQSYPCEKMGCPLTEEDIPCQLQFFIGYINRRYGNPIEAWKFHIQKGWY